MQIGWVPCRIFGAILLCSLGSSTTLAEAADQSRNRSQVSDHPWTVATVAPDGSWGVATEPYIYQAIAAAVSNCKRMSRQQIGCGAQFRVIRAGWIIAMRCANTNIIAAEMNIAAAESAAADRERALRVAYAGEMPACSRVITVNPYGTVIRHTPDRHGPTLTGSSSR